MIEIWRNIDFIEKLNRIEVSNMGRVRNIDTKHFYSLKALRAGYPSVHIENKCFSVHRLVAGAFCENPNNKPCVNHIDGNRQNNNYLNLEWVTYKENAIHAAKTGLCDMNAARNSACEKTKRKVNQYDLLGNFIKSYESMAIAGSSVSGAHQNISACCAGKLKTAYGFKWEYSA